MAIATVLGLTLSAEIYIPQAAGTTPATLTLQQLGFMTHINHIVYVVLENHAYDSYFGTYCLVASNLCPYAANGIPAGTCVPYSTSNPTGPCIRPWNFTTMNWTLKSDLPHNAGSSALAWNKGAMNGFYKAEGAGLDPFGHYNGTTAPIVWDLAEEYTLNDNFYSSVLSYSLPNHWHIVAGQAPSQIFTNGTEGCPTVPVNHTLTSDHLYLAQANKTTSIEDRLLNSSVSWKYYEFALGSYANAIKINLNANKTQITSVGQAYSYWNPQAAKAESYNASFVSHYVLNTQFYRDAKNGTLPDISWVIPPGQDSDHPPQSSAVAQGWLASIVNAVEASPEWNSTVLYITWDDYGGFYDHVDPPMWQGQQLGFRVPMIEISAWTRVGFVSNQMNYFESILRLMEWRFGLKCIATLDCKAPLPLWGFDWNLKGPHSPILFPTNIASASYPYNPKWDGSAGVEVGGYVPPTEYTYFPQGQAPDID
jgi:phospholipase C